MKNAPQRETGVVVRSPKYVRLPIGASGLLGIIHACVIVLRARVQTGYQPVVEDWVFHALIPGLAYANLLTAAIAARATLTVPLFMIGGSAIVLLFAGIHNVWDTVVYIVTDLRPPEPAKEQPDSDRA